MTWDDSKPHILPGTSVRFTPARQRGVFLIISFERGGGIQCGTGYQFVGATPRVEDAAGNEIPFAVRGYTLITPVLTPGTYTVGLSAFCQAPDDINSPAATYYVGPGYIRIDQLRP